jgi:uncharacterized protein DUF2071
MGLLQKNPLTMVGTIERCWLFAYRTPVAEARALLPDQLAPVTHGQWAFWNVVVCRIRAMRPKGLPGQLGVGYWHVAYRLYVRYQAPDSAPVEGLYFVRSDCDSRLMSAAGNLMTDFNFHTAAVRVAENDLAVEIRIDSPDAPAQARLNRLARPELTADSAFGSLEEAAQRLKYQPFGLSVGADGAVNLVRIVRREADWRSRLVRVETADWAFFAGRTVQPEICYEVEPIVYQWNRARVYRPLG